MKKIHELDEKFLEIWGESPDFDLSHNKRVIDESIRKYEAMRRKKEREFDEGNRERAQAASHYLKSLENGGQENPEHYFGKKYLAFLRGEQIRNELQERLKVIGKDGKELQKQSQTSV